MNTSQNEKYKGGFGDPYQNDLKTSRDPVERKNSKFVGVFENFFKGYSDYLGKTFLESYGNYQNETGKTLAFNYFLNLGDWSCSGTSSVRREFSLIVKKYILTAQNLIVKQIE